MAKRVFDLICAIMGLLIIGPLLAIIALFIKLEDNGPVFYRGSRIGRYKIPFNIFKFRSMVVNADQIGGSSTGDDDPRITKIGKLLRKYKLDELPQLFNVLFGDMSIVGPRPEVQYYVDMYTEDEKIILSARPGITDWASLWNSDEGVLLAGVEDPDKVYLEEIRPEKLRLQMEYVQKRNLWVDLVIIVQTIITIIGRPVQQTPSNNQRT